MLIATAAVWVVVVVWPENPSLSSDSEERSGISGGILDDEEAKANARGW